MTRFVHLKNDCTDMLINTRAIVGVSNLDNEIVTVELFDGSTHRVDCSFLHEIAGYDAIIKIYPCERTSAIYEDENGNESSAHVSFMALTAAGYCRPMDEYYTFMDIPFKGYTYNGLRTPNDSHRDC